MLKPLPVDISLSITIDEDGDKDIEATEASAIVKVYLCEIENDTL
jgi:hypothetical protein